MKPTLTNPHDRFFAQIFSDRQNAVDFLGHYLPPPVLKLMDLGSVEIAKDSFVDENLRGAVSGMLYRVQVAGNPAYVYLLFEHKSYSDPLTGFQLLKYMTRIWDLHLKQYGVKTLPLIIPLVIYHGARKWKGGESLGRLVSCPDEALKAYVPDFRFFLYDLSSYSDEEIRGEVLLRVSLLVLKYVFRKDLRGKIEGILCLLGDLAGRQSGIEYLEVLIRYLAEGADKLSREDLLKAVSQIPKGDRIMTSIAQQWKKEAHQEGWREGRQEGRQEGHQEGLRKGWQERGVVEARQVLLEDLEEQFGILPLSLVERISRIDNYEALRTLRRQRKSCEAPADFEQLMERSLH